ncbi:hypothetical protein [Halobacillus sp. B29]
MTIHLFIFKIQVSRRQEENYAPLPGYHPSAEEQWLDRKSSFIHYM